jgi:hypothetical protein
MRKILFTLSACAALVACGGGGGADDGKVTENNIQNDSLVGAAVALSASNYEPAAKEIVGSAPGLQSTASVSRELLTASQANPVPTAAMFLQTKLPEIARALNRSALLTGVAIEDTVDCDQGQIDVAGNDNNNNDELDAGDNAVLTIKNCQLNGFKINGKMSFTVDSGAAYSNLTARDITITSNVQNFRVEVSGIVSVTNGSYTMTISPLSDTNLRVVITATRLTNQLSQAGTSKVFQYTNYTVNATTNPTTTTWSVTGKVSVPTLGANTAEIATLTPFSALTNTSLVTAGQLMITLSNGGKMRVTAQPMNSTSSGSNAKVELDLNSDGVYEESKVLPWIDIL